jgi:hypothetical protein
MSWFVSGIQLPVLSEMRTANCELQTANYEPVGLTSSSIPGRPTVRAVNMTL